MKRKHFFKSCTIEGVFAIGAMTCSFFTFHVHHVILSKLFVEVLHLMFYLIKIKSYLVVCSNFLFGVPNHLFTVVRKRLSELIPKREK